MKAIDPAQWAALEAAVEADPGGRGYPALALLYRRAGRREEAVAVARRGLEHKPGCREGRLVLALVLLDAGRGAEAREELEALVPDLLAEAGFPAPEPAAGGVSESELERAFQDAETDTDQLITPNRVAEAALDHVDAAADEGIEEDEPADEDILPGSAFATATMAELLARQGDESGAERIRASLGADRAGEAPGGRSDGGRDKTIATLERWLARLRGDRS